MVNIIDRYEKYQISEIMLEKIKLAGRKYFGPDEIEQMRFESFEDIFTKVICIQWQTAIFSEKIRNDTKKVTFTYPATWWENFKFTYRLKFPKWYLKKYPIKWKTYEQVVNFEEFASYPKLSEYLKVAPHLLNYAIHTQIEPFNCDMNIMEENDK